MRAFASGSSMASGMSTPTRRARSACCARAESGHAAAAPPSSVMNSSLQDGAEDTMSMRVGLSTRERIMAEQPQAAPLQLAVRLNSRDSGAFGRHDARPEPTHLQKRTLVIAITYGAQWP